MQENCHGALPQLSLQPKRERDAGTRYSVVTDNFSGIAAREAENRPPNEGELRGLRPKTTMSCCLAMWHRVGGRMFVWEDVKDILGSPAQLKGMRNRGYITKVRDSVGSGKFYQGAVWQMTEQARDLAEVREEKWS